jgi:hypothetical protein
MNFRRKRGSGCSNPYAPLVPIWWTASKRHQVAITEKKPGRTTGRDHKDPSLHRVSGDAGRRGGENAAQPVKRIEPVISFGPSCAPVERVVAAIDRGHGMRHAGYCPQSRSVAAVQRVASLDRAKVRAAFERRFTTERMTSDYLEIYQALAAECATSRGRPRKTGQLSIANRILDQHNDRDGHSLHSHSRRNLQSLSSRHANLVTYCLYNADNRSNIHIPVGKCRALNSLNLT